MYESQRMSNKKSRWLRTLDRTLSDMTFIMDSYREGRDWSMGDMMKIAHKLKELGQRGEAIHEEFIRTDRMSRGSQAIRATLAKLETTSNDYKTFLRWEPGITAKLIPTYEPTLLVNTVILPTEQVQLDTQRAILRGWEIAG